MKRYGWTNPRRVYPLKEGFTVADALERIRRLANVTEMVYYPISLMLPAA